MLQSFLRTSIYVQLQPGSLIQSKDNSIQYNFFSSRQPALSRLSHVLLAGEEVSNLLADLVEAAEDLLVAVGEAENRVGDTGLPAELADVDLGLAEVVARQAREQVVDGLELEAAVDEVEPGRAVDVHGGAELALRERLGLAELRRRHAPVAQRDLDVEWHRDDVRDQHEGHADRPRREGAPQQAVPE